MPWGFTLKKEIVEPGRKFEELTICNRVFASVYDANGWTSFKAFIMREGDPILVNTNGYEEKMSKYLDTDILGPTDNPFDVIVTFWASRKNLEKTKDEWRFFRLVTEKLQSLQWTHYCNVYNKPGKNTGIVVNGEVIANRTQNDLWANEDNYYTSYSFEPAKMITQKDGEEIAR